MSGDEEAKGEWGAISLFIAYHGTCEETANKIIKNDFPTLSLLEQKNLLNALCTTTDSGDFFVFCLLGLCHAIQQI